SRWQRSAAVPPVPGRGRADAELTGPRKIFFFTKNIQMRRAPGNGRFFAPLSGASRCLSAMHWDGEGSATQNTEKHKHTENIAKKQKYTSTPSSRTNEKKAKTKE